MEEDNLGDEDLNPTDGSEEPEANFQPPISALPPRVSLMEESQMEVSASPAFQCLDDVSRGRVEGIITHPDT